MSHRRCSAMPAAEISLFNHTRMNMKKIMVVVTILLLGVFILGCIDKEPPKSGTHAEKTPITEPAITTTKNQAKNVTIIPTSTPITPIVTVASTISPTNNSATTSIKKNKSVSVAEIVITPTYTNIQTSCDPSYPTVCIPPPPPDLDCKDVSYKNFKVLSPDPHEFDRDGDGIGCEK